MKNTHINIPKFYLKKHTCYNIADQNTTGDEVNKHKNIFSDKQIKLQSQYS